jgi:hypothetical protein
MVRDPVSFWAQASSLIGALCTDGSLRYILLDKSFKMLPIIRNAKMNFTDFIKTDASAQRCKVVINGNFHDVTNLGLLDAALGQPDAPKDTKIQGMIVKDGKVIGGDSRPQGFWFGQLVVRSKDPYAWSYAAGKGDPPTGASALAAVGNVGPLIIGDLQYGVGNIYRSGAPPGTSEPLTGEPPEAAKTYMIQRNNETFRSASARPPDTGKTILAYCSAKRVVLVAVQQDGRGPGQTHAELANMLALLGFDFAVFLDGSDSSTLVYQGQIVIAPGTHKNATIDVGIGFYQ